MLNIKDIRSNTDFIIKSLEKRNVDNSKKIIDSIIELDKDYRDNLEKKEKLLNQRNLVSKDLGRNKNDKKKFKELSEKANNLKEDISTLDNITIEKKKIFKRYTIIFTQYSS